MAGAARATVPTRAGAAKAPTSSSMPRVTTPSSAGGAPLISLGAAARAGSTGVPIPARVRAPIEASLGADLRDVRVHEGPQAAAAAQSVGARAFTFGNDIFLGSRESPLDVELMAHEAAHVLQQQGQTVVQRAGGGANDTYEHEASSASAAVRAGRSFAVRESTGGAQVQRSLADDVLETAIWPLLERFAPTLVPILKKGPEGLLDWLKERISGAFQSMFDNLMAPVRAIAGAGTWLATTFAPLVTWMQDAAAKIARNDCSPFREAAEKIEAVATAIITPIVEKIRKVADVVRGFLDGIWQKFGAPIWDWIKKFAGEQWRQIEELAAAIWDLTEPVRKRLERAWTWIKNKLGVGEGPEGHNGLLQWVQGKAEAAWNWIKAKLEPYKKQLTIAAGVVGGILVLISPAGPVLIIGGIVVGVIQGVRWIKANWGKGNLVLQARTYLEKTLIPALMGQLNKMTAAVTRMAASLNGTLGSLAASAGAMVTSVAGSVLRFAVDAMQWLAEQAIALARWASEKLMALSDWIKTTFDRVVKFLQPVLDFLGQVGKVVADVYFLPVMLAGKAWNLIPSCIRDPVVDFVGPIILKQIALFRELVKDDAAWQKTKADVMNIIRLIFKNRDILGAVKAVFNLVLRAFNVPQDLLVEVLKKAATAWDAVMDKPIQFIKNAVRAVGHGFGLLWKNLRSHLSFGVEGWLFGELADKGVSAPKSWTNPMDVLGFVLDVLGLSMSHIFELLKKRFDKEKVERLQKWYGRLAKAWEWIKQVIDTSKSAAEVTAGLIDQAKGFAFSILEEVVTWIIKRVGAELAVIATAAAASAGLSEVIDIARRIYKAIVSAVRWMRKILEMVNTALDSVMEIVNGAIEAAGTRVETVMHRAMPVVIGFLAEQFGLGDIGDEMRAIVDKIRAKVDDAILWVIDKVKAAIDAIVSAVKAAVGAITNWWKQRFGFTTKDGLTHTIAVEGSQESADIVVQSKRTYLGELVGLIKDKDDKKAAEAKQREIRDLMSEGRTTKEEKAMNDLSDRIGKKLAEMSDILVKSGVLDQVVVPAPEYKYEVEDLRAKRATVRNLSAIRPWGSTPGSADVRGWKYVQAIGATQGGAMFRRLHLLNERFGGPGMSSNLAVAGKTDNETHLYDVENEVKKLVGDRPNDIAKTAIVEYTVQVEYARPDTPLKCGAATASLKDFPTRFDCEWTAILDPKKSKKAESKISIGFDMTDWQKELLTGNTG